MCRRHNPYGHESGNAIVVFISTMMRSLEPPRRWAATEGGSPVRDYVATAKAWVVTAPGN